MDIEVIDSQECKAVYDQLQVSAFRIGDTEICATGPRGGKDSCFGDSGGPLFGEHDGDFIQVRTSPNGPRSFARRPIPPCTPAWAPAAQLLPRRRSGSSHGVRATQLVETAPSRARTPWSTPTAPSSRCTPRA